MHSFKKVFTLLLILVLSYTTSFAADKNKTALDTALTPIGWAIGAAITPAYLGAEAANKTVEWTGENVAAPLGEGTVWVIGATINSTDWITGKAAEGLMAGSKYTVVPIAKGISKSGEIVYEYVFAPTGEALFRGMEITYEYGICPTLEGVQWSFEQAINGVVFGSKYTIIPISKGFVWVAKNGQKYVLAPMINGISDSIIFVVVPAGKGFLWGAKYTVVPIAKGVGYGFGAVGKGMKITGETIGDGVEWSAENIIYPVGYGIGKGTDAVVKPIGTAVKSASKSTADAIKTILRRK